PISPNKWSRLRKRNGCDPPAPANRQRFHRSRRIVRASTFAGAGNRFAIGPGFRITRREERNYERAKTKIRARLFILRWHHGGSFVSDHSPGDLFRGAP